MIDYPPKPAIYHAMVSRDLYDILMELDLAGSIGVDAGQLGWNIDQLGQIERALSMRYMRRDHVNGDVLFSLTAAGFRAIDREPQTWKLLKLHVKLLLN